MKKRQRRQKMSNFEQVTDNTERLIGNNTTTFKEFKYYESDGFVQAGLPYTIYYTLDKEKIYLTGLPSDNGNTRRISKVNETDLFVKYQDVANRRRENYPKQSKKLPTQNDYEVGEFRRFFCKKSNDNTAQIFEISEDDFNNQSSLYDYYDIDWTISGKKSNVRSTNQVRLRSLQKRVKEIGNYLDPLEYWRPQTNSLDDVQKKLSFLKK